MAEHTDFTTSTLPFLNQTGPEITCPCYSVSFNSAEAVVLHLSDASECGQWVVEYLPNLQGSGVQQGHEFGDDTDAAQDGMLIDPCLVE